MATVYILLDLEGQLDPEQLVQSICKPETAFKQDPADNTLLLATADNTLFRCEAVETAGSDLYVLQTGEQLHPISTATERLHLQRVARV